MGLVIKLNNIISPNAFTVSYKTGPNPYPLDSGFTSYGGTYSAGTTLVVVSGITINFNSSYWFKITDNVTNRYIIENVETNDPIAYMSCCPIPVATAICYHECYPPSNVDADCIGLTPTPTPTPTPVCDVPTDVTAECTTIEPTQTPTPTPTATPTPTPTPLPNTTWYFNHGSGTSCTASYLEILRNGSQVVLATNPAGGATGALNLTAGDQLIIRVNTGQAMGSGCENAYVKYDSQQLVEDTETGFNNAEIYVTVTQNDINYGITICGTLAGGICPV